MGILKKLGNIAEDVGSFALPAATVALPTLLTGGTLNPLTQGAGLAAAGALLGTVGAGSKGLAANKEEERRKKMMKRFKADTANANVISALTQGRVNPTVQQRAPTKGFIERTAGSVGDATATAGTVLSATSALKEKMAKMKEAADAAAALSGGAGASAGAAGAVASGGTTPVSPSTVSNIRQALDPIGAGVDPGQSYGASRAGGMIDSIQSRPARMATASVAPADTAAASMIGNAPTMQAGGPDLIDEALSLPPSGGDDTFAEMGPRNLARLEQGAQDSVGTGPALDFGRMAPPQTLNTPQPGFQGGQGDILGAGAGESVGTGPALDFGTLGGGAKPPLSPSARPMPTRVPEMSLSPAVPVQRPTVGINDAPDSFRASMAKGRQSERLELPPSLWQEAWRDSTGDELQQALMELLQQRNR